MGIIVTSEQPALEDVIALYRERVHTLVELAESVAYFYRKPLIDAAAKEKHLTQDILPVLNALAVALADTEWSAEAIHAAIDHAVQSNGLKFPKVAMPLRVLITGGAQSPSIDAVMALLGKTEVLARIGEGL